MGRWASVASLSQRHRLPNGGQPVRPLNPISNRRRDYSPNRAAARPRRDGERYHALTEELARYDPLAYRLHRPRDGEDDNYIRRRYRENVKELLNFVKRVEGGESAPLRNEIIIEWGEIDDDVRAVLAEDGAPEGISGHEVFRRSVERQMEGEGEGGATVVVSGTETRDDEEETPTGRYPRVATPVDSCVECGAKRPDVFFTSWELGYSLCQACYEARETRDEGPQ